MGEPLVPGIVGRWRPSVAQRRQVDESGRNAGLSQEPGVPALERARLSRVFQNYVRPETLAAANAPLVARQAGLLLARAWGGGLVAAVDGMRFVVPVPAAMQFAAPVTPGSMPAAPVDRPRLRTGGNFALLCGEGGQHLLLLALGHVEVIQGVGQFRGNFVEHLR